MPGTPGHGRRPKRRASNPTPTRPMGRPPLLSNAARPVYQRLVRALASMAIPVGAGDEHGLAVLAELITDFHARPTVAKASAIRQLSAEYGLTPASRSRLSVAPSEGDTDPFGDLTGDA